MHLKKVSVGSLGAPRGVRYLGTCRLVHGLGGVSGVDSTPPHQSDGARRNGPFRGDPEGRVVGWGNLWRSSVSLRGPMTGWPSARRRWGRRRSGPPRSKPEGASLGRARTRGNTLTPRRKETPFWGSPLSVANRGKRTPKAGRSHFPGTVSVGRGRSSKVGSGPRKDFWVGVSGHYKEPEGVGFARRTGTVSQTAHWTPRRTDEGVLSVVNLRPDPKSGKPWVWTTGHPIYPRTLDPLMDGVRLIRPWTGQRDPGLSTASVGRLVVVLVVGERPRVSTRDGRKCSSRRDGVPSCLSGISIDIVKLTTWIRDFGESGSQRFVYKGHRESAYRETSILMSHVDLILRVLDPSTPLQLFDG